MLWFDLGAIFVRAERIKRDNVIQTRQEMTSVFYLSFRALILSSSNLKMSNTVTSSFKRENPVIQVLFKKQSANHI